MTHAGGSRFRAVVHTAIATAVLGVALAPGLAVAGVGRVASGSGGSPGSGGASGAAVAQAAGSMVIELSKITPAAPTETSTLTISGVVRNTGTTRIGRIEVGLSIGLTPLTLRSQPSRVEAGLLPRSSRPVPGAQSVLADGIDPDDFAPFRLSVPVSSLGLPAGEQDRGVYQLDLTATAPGSSVPDRELTTYLPWMPELDSIEPTRLSWLWPLVDRPVRDSADLFMNDRLATSVAPDGRLSGLVDAAAGKPVTWVVDPDLLQTAEQMAKGYRVRTEDGTVAGTGRAAAADWLDRLRAAIGQNQVMNLPYADVDVTALRRNGLTSDIGTADTVGADIAQDVLRRDTTSNVSWPPGDLTDRQTLRALRAAGQQAVILADTALPPAGTLTYTPDGRGRLSTPAGTLEPLLIDTELSGVLRPGRGDRRGAGPLMIQRFLAETALITLQRPNDSRSLVVAAPRYWNVDPRTAAELLEVAGTTPWVTSVPLSAVREVEPPALPRVVAEYPSRAQSAELPADYLTDARRTRTRLQRFIEILSGPGPTSLAYTAARLRTESAAWRRTDGKPGVSSAGRSFLRGMSTNLDELRRQVSIVSAGTVTLSSHSGSIPVTVRNELPQPVSIEVYVESTRQDRLQVVQPPPVTVPAGGVAPVSVQAEAVANGPVEVRVRLRNSEGDPISDWQSIKVQVTNYGTVGSVIIAGATGLLFLSATVRIVRRGLARRRRRAAQPGTVPVEQVEVERVQA